MGTWSTTLPAFINIVYYTKFAICCITFVHAKDELCVWKIPCAKMDVTLWDQLQEAFGSKKKRVCGFGLNVSRVGGEVA